MSEDKVKKEAKKIVLDNNLSMAIFLKRYEKYLEMYFDKEELSDSMKDIAEVLSGLLFIAQDEINDQMEVLSIALTLINIYIDEGLMPHEIVISLILMLSASFKSITQDFYNPEVSEKERNSEEYSMENMEKWIDDRLAYISIGSTFMKENNKKPKNNDNLH